MINTEQKILRYFDAEMRTADSEEMTVEGYALKFERWTQIGGPKWGFKEKIARGATNNADFTETVFDLNHDMNSLLAGKRNNTLQLSVDDIGLKIVAKIIDTALGRDAYKLIKDGLIAKMSFMAMITGQFWEDAENETETDKRTITQFGKFYDVSAVTFPAYDDTSIATARGLDIDREIYFRQMQKLNQILGGNKQ